MKRILSPALGIALLVSLLGGCAQAPAVTAPTDGDTRQTTAQTVPPAQVDFSKTEADMFSDRDKEIGYDESTAVHITLSGSSASATSETVIIDGSTVTITQDATYILSGTLEDGTVIVNTPESAKPHLILNGASITSSTGAALYIPEADKVFVTLAANTENSLTGGSFPADDDSGIDGALFSRQDLTLNGTGSLTVTSPSGHGIVCKDDLVLTGGTYTVQSASHGLDANDSIRLTGSTLSVTAGKDGLHVENSDDPNLGFLYIRSGEITVAAEGDGLSAGAYAQLEGGSLAIVAGGGSENGSKASSDRYGGFMGGGFGGPGGMGRPGKPSDTQISNNQTTEEASTSMKGIKSAGSLLFSDGSYTIDAADDAIHADGSVTVNGGAFTIATGDDALHAEDTLTVTGGTVDISESYEGLEALHIAVSGGDIRLVSSDDGLNAAGGTDSSGTTGGRDGMFGGGGMGKRPGGMGGFGGSANGSIVISGGKLYARASGDGIDANGTLEISGGYTVVCGPTQGDTATLDYDSSAVITGGTFIGTGASGMAQTFSDARQGILALRAGSQSAGTQITVKDQAGNVVISHTPELDFQVVILSCPELIGGESYELTIGTVTETFQAEGTSPEQA